MKILILTILSMAILGSLIVAYPQQVYYQKLPYYPPSTSPPRPMRVRRAVGGGQASTKPAGGVDTKLYLSHGIGTPDHNVTGKVIAAGNTTVSSGGALADNNKGSGASIDKEHTSGVRETLTKSRSADILNNDNNKLKATVFESNNTLANGLQFELNGNGLSFSSSNGHGFSFTQSKIPNFGHHAEFAGKANLWSSADRNSRLDLTGTASQWYSGPLSGQKNVSAGLVLTHMSGEDSNNKNITISL